MILFVLPAWHYFVTNIQECDGLLELRGRVSVSKTQRLERLVDQQTYRNWWITPLLIFNNNSDVNEIQHKGMVGFCNIHRWISRISYIRIHWSCCCGTNLFPLGGLGNLEKANLGSGYFWVLFLEEPKTMHRKELIRKPEAVNVHFYRDWSLTNCKLLYIGRYMTSLPKS